ncbi:MAG: aminoacetone oxidase family FAD-binding enzyme [Planctomycetota bacterium]|nr:aminoacetone oxidase family FAD-binding enzyme [Planctomycetota bacterium]MDP6520639.1 aminoacetone oxidase family FAD-binding enzyme [Planctomycetota bacterium]MDP6838093.1 aminoacetone oxidase family FAD-binding enzyme [Planctomycetota bacterium]MDP6954902.1 aminoacetone oxidase family FAD-binding enzyme [Planctomycetota bacterium]
MNKGTVIIGAGAAGSLAALFAARAGQSVLFLDGEEEPGRKILISGGGRCNVLPATVADAAFHTSGSQPLLRRLLSAWPLEEVQAFFERDLRLPLRREKDKLFPKSQRARDVRDALVKEAIKAKALLEVSWKVAAVERTGKGFLLTATDGRQLTAERLILAAGGQSVPTTGSDGSGFALARSLGHELTPLYPALVPLLTDDEDLRALAGLSLPVRWTARAPARDGDPGRVLGTGERELLFTHRGFSGPAIMDASHFVTRDKASLHICWTERSAEDWGAALADPGSRTVHRLLRKHLPARLATTLAHRVGLEETDRLAELPRATRQDLVQALANFTLPISGHRGFAHAEVTGGGVPLAELHSKTLESRRVPGLHICGELLDAQGPIGGHNFLLAWISGRLAGQA